VGTLTPARFTLATLAYVGIAFAVEPYTGHAGEYVIGLVTWVLLLGACRGLARQERTRVAALVLIACVGEVLGSLVLGLYAYRRGGIPFFVPPGHGLIYLAGYRLSQTAFIRRHGVRLALAGGAVWAVLGLVLGGRPDLAGALAMLALFAFLLRGSQPGLYASMLLVVAFLELYGTAMGTWHWEPYWPGSHLPSGNPPSGVAAGYCVFDALALRLTAMLNVAVPVAFMRRSHSIRYCSVPRAPVMSPMSRTRSDGQPNSPSRARAWSLAPASSPATNTT
jgi:hypothetical protein